MPRLIDADALEAYIKDYACIPCKEYGADKDGIRCDFCGFGFCLEGIKRHTAHDAEPVVRCKDCTRYVPFKDVDGVCLAHNKGALIIMSQNGYCNLGERKEDETD